ncbi:hypothetical protein XENTR_v10006087 [Xenopus tropicalis]|uniref:Uroplakin-3b n=1 Tax=Xenopus tropicalis TaxID=8364 RepID=A0A6I8SLV3_XENTR|nr:uroplakin-3b isoform X2 [Xenopus tropicalis]KAE8624897.1 hypothetical protein XENTR_v10006087 [Xenopus tropicalis]|eukprot:XP_002934406.2 PREDICTED: uroplakin-3b-like [Xenopus tropicalis]
MDQHIKLGLLIATSVVAFADVGSYVPKITTSILGNLTFSTFVLEQPQCIFSSNYPTQDVWLVVALDTVEPFLTDTNLSTPVTYSSFTTNKFYHTLRVRGADYPCFNESAMSLALLQVGADEKCNESFCNGPLTSPGPYRVRFVVLNNTGMVAKTNRSDLIRLPIGINYTTIDTWPLSRSGSMIVITTILSILLAVLLACLLAALCSESKSVCWSAQFEANRFMESEEPGYYTSSSIYRLHNSYAQWDKHIQPQKENARDSVFREQIGNNQYLESENDSCGPTAIYNVIHPYLPKTKPI